MMRIAVIDSGIHASHPHIGGIAGGIEILPGGSSSGDFVDRIGHGTAVAAAIRERAPEAQLFAVKIFDRKLAANVDLLTRAIEWCAEREMDWINLSLGTANQEHAEPLRRAIRNTQGKIVSAYGYLPGNLEGTIPVLLDWDCARDQVRTRQLEDGRTAYLASGYPRPIPGVPPEQNLKGISFAVANVTGWLAANQARFGRR